MGLLDSVNQNTYYNTPANYGDYQFVSLDHIINGFMVAYVGESKLIPKVNRTDIQFHGMRAIQEFSYDIFKSVKAQEIEVPNTLKMILPQDYVNYTKLARVGSDGVERVLYPTGKTSNPLAIQQASDGSYSFSGDSSVDYRTITITCPAKANLNDGDNLSIGYTNTSGVNSNAFFIFDTDGDVVDGAWPADASANQRNFVAISNSITTAAQVATALANSINDSLRFTATTSGANVTITYKYIKASYVESILSKDGGAISSFTKTVVNAGATTVNDQLQYQTESDTWANYKSQTSSSDNDDVDSLLLDAQGRRYGLDPQHAQDNGTFYIDTNSGYINFGSSLAGETIVLHYISDGLGTDGEMVVHKFAEEAVYKWIAYGVIASRSNIPEYIVQRFKKERFAEARKAKIRLSNIKIEEFAQVLKGLSKPIK
jgi:hypothetical protein